MSPSSKILLAATLLSACASADAAPPKAGSAGLAGFSPVSGPVIQNGRYTAAPEAIVAFVASLPTRDVLLPKQLRQRLMSAQVYLRSVAGTGGRTEYLLADKNGARYSLWVRSFEGRRRGTAGYLVQMRMPCASIATAQTESTEDLAAARRACARPQAEFADSGLRAYIVAAGRTPVDVTASLRAPELSLGRERLDRYRSLGANPIALDDSRAGVVPVLRWVVEADPEQPLSPKDTRSFQGGTKAHAGFVIWSGDRFEVRDSLPRDLWPCPPRDEGCPDPRDRYVLGKK